MLDIKNVSKNYDKNTALQNVNITISSGVCFGLIGPNGAGKSTLMKILSGIIENYEGEVTFEGSDVKTNSHKIKKQIGYVPQDIVLNETLSAVDNLEFFGSVNGLTSKETKIKAMEVLELVGLMDRGKEAVKTFSGGMKRRINIGCALMHNPKFIIMDEPTVGVDPQSRNYIFEIIHKLKTQNITVLYSSHYMEEIEHLCDYIALIDKGSVLENGTIQAILQKYSTPSIYVEGELITEKMFTSLGKVFTKGSGFVVENKETLTLLEKITELLKEDQLEVTRLEIAKPNLEDIFLKLTGTSLRD